MGASDYAMSRYTDDDTGADPTPNSRVQPSAADTPSPNSPSPGTMQKLIPYIKAAQAVNPNLRFWASPWTPPVWMKTGYRRQRPAERRLPRSRRTTTAAT